jgi:hypothetical protein
MKEQFLCPFAHTVTDRVAVSHSINCRHTHMLIVALHKAFLLSSQTLTFAGGSWICQHMHVVFVVPNYCCHVTNCHHPNICTFQFVSCYWKSSGIPIQFGITVPQQFILCSVKSLSEEKKSNCPYIQGGSNMTRTDCGLFTHNQSRSYLNHLAHIILKSYSLHTIYIYIISTYIK